MKIYMLSRSINLLSVGFTSLIMFSVVSCKGHEPKASSAYITEVFEYVYAPGQHAGLTKPTDVSDFIGEPTSDKSWLYLGGFGGYVVAGFDHPVLNGEGADFGIYNYGNSPEPAVVYVMPDTNGDGKPNDTWYELKGNQFENSKRNYWVRYYKALSDSANITWKDSKGNIGELISGFGATNSAAWWWPFTTVDSITFKGTRLPDAYDNDSINGNQYWTVPHDRFTWGYAENCYGTDYDTKMGANKLDISNAVDSLGNAVNLQSIRFIKVQTAVLQQAGWTNEVSAEIRGAKDLRY
ncbi:MAG: hypothetical protein WCS79_01965 [Paludibacter sp.]